jgi:pyridoxal phosphate-dependent aminotransferase EpsN
MLNNKIENKILLSMPHMSGQEMCFIEDAFKTNWVAPLGPNVSAFEADIENYIGIKKAVAMSSGTAAIHIALELLEVEQNDIIFASSLTFVATANPILYQKAQPVFIDSEPNTWNMSPLALEKAFQWAEKKGKRPKAVIVVDLFGMPANYSALHDICQKYEVPIITDAAESLGSSYGDKKCGSLGIMSILSFNGNKIITTGGGGMLLSNDTKLMEKALFLITQARDPAPYYQHSHMGFNYRMSNILAGIGRGQMQVLDQRVQRRREIYQLYQNNLKDDGLQFYKEENKSFSNRWLSTACLHNDDTRNALDLISYLAEKNIEARPVWKPMHLQPLFKDCEFFAHDGFENKSVANNLFERGICLPSATNYENETFEKVIKEVKFWLKK